MTGGEREGLAPDHADPVPQADAAGERLHTSDRRRRVLVDASAVAATCAVLVLGMSGHALVRGDPHGLMVAGGGFPALSAEELPGAPSIQAAVDQYVAAIRAGDGALMARVVDKGNPAQARNDRLRRADGHPVTVTKVTLEDTPSIAWKTVVLQLDDGGVRSTEEVMAGPTSSEFQGDPHSWKIQLSPGT